jgi:hypothetical protein
VPGNPTLGTTTDFCVAKYEMKDNSGAKSEAAGEPWAWIDQTDAKTECTNIGADYHLITNPEWMTIAHNIENVAENWDGGVVGTILARGHGDNAPAGPLQASTDDDPCFGTGQTCSDITWDLQRRTHKLSNGEVIWDLSGNVYNWIDWNVVTDKASPAEAWLEINDAVTTVTMTAETFQTSDPLLDSTNGIGSYYP